MSVVVNDDVGTSKDNTCKSFGRQQDERVCDVVEPVPTTFVILLLNLRL